MRQRRIGGYLTGPRRSRAFVFRPPVWSRSSIPRGRGTPRTRSHFVSLFSVWSVTAVAGNLPEEMDHGIRGIHSILGTNRAGGTGGGGLPGKRGRWPGPRRDFLSPGMHACPGLCFCSFIQVGCWMAEGPGAGHVLPRSVPTLSPVPRLVRARSRREPSARPTKMRLSARRASGGDAGEGTVGDCMAGPRRAGMLWRPKRGHFRGAQRRQGAPAAWR
jgi:hypothetical protein